MTSPLVKPTSGYSGFSRLESWRCRPSTVTLTLSLLDTGALLGRLVVADAQEAGVAEHAGRGPLAVGDLHDQVGRAPDRVPGVLARHLVVERAGLARPQPPAQVGQQGVAEAGAGVAGVPQPAVLVVAQQQRAERAGPPTLAGPVSAHHQIHRLGVLD